MAAETCTEQYTVYHVSGCCDPAFVYDHEPVFGEKIKAAHVVWPDAVDETQHILCGSCGKHIQWRDLGFEAQNMYRAAMQQS